MLLGLVEDFTTTVTLDTELTAVPDSGMYFNSGVHQSITIDNLLHFLPNVDFTFGTYAGGTTYGKFEDSRIKTDIVTDSGIIYQSISDANVGNTPASSPTKWVATNIDSLRLKMFIFSVQDRVLADLKLTKRLVDQQYLYNVGDVINDTAIALSGDFSGIALEFKGSDYVDIKINEIALQAPTGSPVSLFVVNQGQLIDTITLNPTADGRLTFEAQTNKILSGQKGRWVLAFPSQDVFNNSSYVDPLKFDGFVAYTVNGTGASAQAAEYNINTIGNGLNLNISAYTNTSQYVTDNLQYFGNYFQAMFELTALQMYLQNANNRSNRQERIQMSTPLLEVEVMDLQRATIAAKVKRERKQAVKQLEKTFDRELSDNDNFEITINSV